MYWLVRGGPGDCEWKYVACSFGRIWLISYDLLVNEQYFSLTPNQSIIFSAILISQTWRFPAPLQEQNGDRDRWAYVLVWAVVVAVVSFSSSAFLAAVASGDPFLASFVRHHLGA